MFLPRRALTKNRSVFVEKRNAFAQKKNVFVKKERWNFLNKRNVLTCMRNI